MGQILEEYGNIIYLIIVKSKSWNSLIYFLKSINSIQRDNPNVLWIFYEDLITDREKCIEVIASKYFCFDLFFSYYSCSYNTCIFIYSRFSWNTTWWWIKSNYYGTIIFSIYEGISSFFCFDKKLIQILSYFFHLKTHDYLFDEHVVFDACKVRMGFDPDTKVRCNKINKGKQGESKRVLSQEMRDLLDLRWKEVITSQTGIESYQDLRAQLSPLKKWKEMKILVYIYIFFIPQLN